MPLNKLRQIRVFLIYISLPLVLFALSSLSIALTSKTSKNPSKAISRTTLAGFEIAIVSIEAKKKIKAFGVENGGVRYAQEA